MRCLRLHVDTYVKEKNRPQRRAVNKAVPGITIVYDISYYSLEFPAQDFFSSVHSNGPDQVVSELHWLL